MLHQLPSNQRFVRLVSRSFRVTTLSNNIGEKNMGRNNGARLEQDCGGGRGRWRETQRGVECLSAFLGGH